MSRFDEDLARWEAGQLPLHELRARWPDEDVDGLVRAHAMLADAGSEPAPDPFASWPAVRAALDERGGLMQRLRMRSRRVTLGFATAGLVVAGSIAYAAVPPVRRAISDLIGGETPGLVQPGSSLEPEPVDDVDDVDETDEADEADEVDEVETDDDQPKRSGDDDQENEGDDDQENEGDDDGDGAEDDDDDGDDDEGGDDDGDDDDDEDEDDDDEDEDEDDDDEDEDDDDD